MKLTTKMQHHLAIVSTFAKSGDASYGNGLDTGTLRALERRGLVRALSGPGAFYSPRTAIRWQITDAGREALSHQEGRGR